MSSKETLSPEEVSRLQIVKHRVVTGEITGDTISRNSNITISRKTAALLGGVVIGTVLGGILRDRG